MAINKELKSTIIKKFSSSETNTGGSEAQIALLSERIRQVSAHLKLFPKDQHSRTGLLQMVGDRKKLFTYLKRTNLSSYNTLYSSLKG